MKLSEKLLIKLRVALDEVAEDYGQQVQKVLWEERQHKPILADSITFRKDPSAPNPVAVGAYRDTIDSGDLANSQTDPVEIDPNTREITWTADHAATVHELYIEFTAIARDEMDFKQAFSKHYHNQP